MSDRKQGSSRILRENPGQVLSLGFIFSHLVKSFSIVHTSGIKASVLTWGFVFVMKLRNISTTRYEIEKFKGMNDFSLWRVKMIALLVQQGMLKVLKGKEALPATWSDDDKYDILDQALTAM
ncbi:hypothetical protein CerSpe_168720 [Prunus speciosa]